MYQTGGGSGNDDPDFPLALNFKKFKMTYRPGRQGRSQSSFPVEYDISVGPVG